MDGVVYQPGAVVWSDEDEDLEPFVVELEGCIDCFLGPMGIEPGFLRMYLEYADYGVERYKLSYWWGKSQRNIVDRHFYKSLLDKVISRMTVNTSEGLFKLGDFEATGVIFTREVFCMLSASRYFGRLPTGEVIELLSMSGKPFALSEYPCVSKPKILACYFARNARRYPMLAKLVRLYRKTFPRDAAGKLINGYAGVEATADLWGRIVDGMGPDFSTLVDELDAAASEINLVIDSHCCYEEALNRYNILNYEGRFELMLDNYNML